MEFQAIAFLNEEGRGIPNVRMGGTARIHAVVRANADIGAPIVGLRLHDRMSNLVFAAGSRQLRVALPPLRAGEELIIRFALGFTVNPGTYTLTLDCSEPSTEGPNFGIFHDVIEGLGPVTVHYETQDAWPFYGIAQLPLQIAYTRPAGRPDPVTTT